MITATVLTKNNARTLKKTLDSLVEFPQVILLDTGSEDDTLLIVKDYPNVVIHKHSFIGFGPLHQKMVELADFDWILSIDSDEVLSSSLAKEILHSNLDPKKGYAINRHNYFGGKHIRFGGWYPDWIVRLFHRGHYNFSDDLVHEKVVIDSKHIIRLKDPLYHTTYPQLRDLMYKANHYSELFAKQHQGKDSSFFKAFSHGLWAYVRFLVLRRGILCGKQGLILAFHEGYTTFFKYLKLAEKNKE